jgi:hypothetical protein
VATRRRSPQATRSAAAGSWLALLAATTLGDAADTVRAEIRANGLSNGARYRLVVHSYDVPHGGKPDRYARPVGSTQRAVTADELREGVQVDLLEIRPGSASISQEPLVLAWLEAPGPDLDFDARSARPIPGSVYGLVKRATDRGVVQIELNRRA